MNYYERHLGDYIKARDAAKSPRSKALANRRLRAARLEFARAKGVHTDAEWKTLVEEMGGRCVICGCEISSPTKDHITPIYQGGSDGIDNLQPLCRSCNSSKGADSFNWVAFRRAHGFAEGM